MNDGRDENSFDERLKQARERQGLAKPDRVPGVDTAPPSDAGVGIRIGAELAATLAVALVIGIELDRWLHTSPAFVLLFFVLGAVAGVMRVVRTASPPRRPPEQH